MAQTKPKKTARAFKKATKKQGERKYILILYVTGMTPRSIQAVNSLKKICKESLKGCYDLKVIDIYQQPDVAKREQLVAAPTLIKKLPLPLRRFIGDMSDTEKILAGLDMQTKK